MNLGSSIGGNGAAHDDEAIARLLFAGGLLRRRRVRRLLLARLLNEARETGEEPEYEDEDVEEGGGASDHKIARFLIASGLLRRRRMRRMILAHLLRERHEEMEPEFGEFEGGGGFEAEEGGRASDQKIARFLIASGILRRRRLRRMVLAHLLRERHEGVEPEFGAFEGVGGFGEEGPSSEHKLARFLIASGILRRRRLRRILLAHLLRERGEGVEPFVGGEEVGFGEGEEIGGGDDRRIVRQLVASGLLRKRRLRRILLARLLRERGGFGEEGEEFGEEETGGGEEVGFGGGFGRQRMHMEGGAAWAG